MFINQREDAEKDAFLKLSANLAISEALWRFLEFKEISLAVPQMEAPLLDLGCGNGQFSYALFQKIKAGVDSNAELLKAARNLNVYDILLAADARDLPFPNNSFKTVFCNCTLEHINNPEKCIAEVNRVLDKKGKFIMTVPSEFFNDMLLFHSKWYANMRNRHLSHINLFTLETWENLLDNSGFNVAQTLLYAPLGFMKLWDCLDIGYRTRVPYTASLWGLLLRRKAILSLLYRKLSGESSDFPESQKKIKKGGGRLFIAEKR
ncbi:MAG: class I SAM-dependent methyltransferase [Dehalococcoidia bacterium]|jgi:SAM-dependent methyltransferase